MRRSGGKSVARFRVGADGAKSTQHRSNVQGLTLPTCRYYILYYIILYYIIQGGQKVSCSLLLNLCLLTTTFTYGTYNKFATGDIVNYTCGYSYLTLINSNEQLTFWGSPYSHSRGLKYAEAYSWALRFPLPLKVK